MRIDVINVFQRQTRVFDRLFHAEYGADPFRMRAGNMIAVRTVRKSCHLGNDLCAPFFRILFGLNDQRAAAFPDDEPIPVTVKRTAGSLRIIIVGRQRMGGR